MIDITNISRLFRFVSIANYFMLLAGTGILTILGKGIWQTNSVAEIIGLLFVSMFLGFVAWVGWTNVGVLGAVVNRKTLLGLLPFAFVSCVIALWGGATLAIAPRVKNWDDVFRTTCLSGSVALASFPASIAVLILRRIKLPKMKERLQSFLRRSVATAHTDGRSFQPINRVKGWGFVFLAFAWLVGWDYLPRQVNTYLPGGGGFGFVFLIYARHYLRPSFHTVLASDTRPPVVFLRSFEDDAKLNHHMAGSSWYDFSLESRLGDHFSSFGPFIAVGKPGDKNPHLGAVRADFSDSEWQDAVLAWMDRAALIIVMIGRTHWVDWELQRIIERGHTGKLIIVFPQWKIFSSGYRKGVEERCAVIRSAFGPTEWNESLQSIPHTRNLRSLAFLPGGRLVAVTSSARNRESYHLAALLCHDAQLEDRGVRPPIPESSRSSGCLRPVLIGTAITMLAGIVIAALLLAHAPPGSAGPDVPAALEWEPVPAESVTISEGALEAGKFSYLDVTGAQHGSTFHPGETLQFRFYIHGAAVNVKGVGNVRNEVNLFNANGEKVLKGDPTDIPVNQLNKKEIPFAWRLPLNKSAPVGEFRWVIKLVDTTSGSRFEFSQPMRIAQEAAK